MTERIGKDNMLFYHYDNIRPMKIKTAGFHTTLIDSKILAKTLDVKLIKDFANNQNNGIDWVNF